LPNVLWLTDSRREQYFAHFSKAKWDGCAERDHSTERFGPMCSRSFPSTVTKSVCLCRLAHSANPGEAFARRPLVENTPVARVRSHRTRCQRSAHLLQALRQFQAALSRRGPILSAGAPLSSARKAPEDAMKLVQQMGRRLLSERPKGSAGNPCRRPSA
jgi:hypothetical protein